MKKVLLLMLFSTVCTSSLTFAQMADTRCYEMRIYYPEAGKMNDLQARFRNYTTKLFEKHGMTNIGYWVPQRKPDSVLIYVMAYPSREARDASWKNFGNDPEWKTVQSESEKNGKLVAKVTSIFMSSTDFSPNNFQSVGNRVFELRTYKATKYNLGLLLARFRNYTLNLFAKYGMTNLVYWTQNGGSQNGGSQDDTLIYLLAHNNKEAAAASFDGFRKDPEWVEVRAASEKLGKGSLTVSVVSEFLIPTDFSTWK